VDHAGHSQLSHPWRDNITSRAENSLTLLSSNVLTVILSLMDAREVGRTIACGMSMTMVVSPLRMSTLTLQQIATVSLIGILVQSKSMRFTTSQDTLRLLSSPPLPMVQLQSLLMLARMCSISTLEELSPMKPVELVSIMPSLLWVMEPLMMELTTSWSETPGDLNGEKTDTSELEETEMDMDSVESRRSPTGPSPTELTNHELLNRIISSI